jgi:hypothetical protein
VDVKRGLRRNAKVSTFDSCVRRKGFITTYYGFARRKFQSSPWNEGERAFRWFSRCAT